MQVTVETKTIQAIDGQKQIIQQKGNGTFEVHEKGSVLSWNVIEEKQQFRMTILENKIILKTNNETRTFELGKKTKTILQTEYGNLNMYIKTKKMQVLKQHEIRKIELIYDIQIEDTKSYENTVEITIKS